MSYDLYIIENITKVYRCVLGALFLIILPITLSVAVRMFVVIVTETSLTVSSNKGDILSHTIRSSEVEYFQSCLI